MTKKKKAMIGIISATAILLVAALIALLICGSKWGIPPFGFIRDNRLKKLEGNGDKYAVENVQALDSSPLEGLNVLYLGSSVTYGSASLGTTFVEFMAKRNNFTYVKEAVSGTTLVEEGKSYVKRLKKINKSEEFDLFVCQLSTNDATKKKALGNVDDSGTKTVCGAINFIIDYVRETWYCPVVFFTNSYYENENYSAMVMALNEIANIKEIGVIDLYTDADFNNISEEQRKLYMEDKIHPTKAGYLEWWTPKMEQYLYDYINGQSSATLTGGIL